MATTQSKLNELLDLAEAEGIKLPYPPDMIARLEETGAIVDLNTGEIKIGEADNVRFTLTTYGEAWEHLNRLGLL